jgi:hypothetical protein
LLRGRSGAVWAHAGATPKAGEHSGLDVPEFALFTLWLDFMIESHFLSHLDTMRDQRRIDRVAAPALLGEQTPTSKATITLTPWRRSTRARAATTQ